MRYALVSLELYSAAGVARELPPSYRVVRRLDDLAVLIEGTGDLPRMHGLTEIAPATAAVLLALPPKEEQ